ncbi:MAG: hypothetical protein HY617_00060 [Candidatus Sungbacteria bacterium]|nr:hypothetical protein [Candidatus Sungbacteria bacterium]
MTASSKQLFDDRLIFVKMILDCKLCITLVFAQIKRGRYDEDIIIMDILEAYEKNQPKAQSQNVLPTEGQLLAQRYAPDTGFFIRLVMKLSGGRIQNNRQASYVLLGIAGIIMIISLFLFFSSGTAEPLPESSPTFITGSSRGQ